MAVLPSLPPKSPAKPAGLEVKVQPNRSLHIHWEVEETACLSFQLEICYFEFDGPVIDPFYSSGIIEVERWAYHFLQPQEVPKNKVWVLRTILKAISEEGLVSQPAEKQVTLDDELSMEETLADLTEQVQRFQQRDLEPFVAAKGPPRIVVMGGQHHGKSSHINHLSRCLRSDLSLNDHMDQAPEGEEEKTVALKSLEIPVGSSHIVLVDTPAFPNMSDETQGKLRTLLSTGVPDGARRQDLAPEKQSSFGRPPHGAILLMSLCHWRDQRGEMEAYLKKMAGVFKTASNGTVVFPYVVVATFRDEFLKNCQKDNPREELERAVEGIKKFALTDHVYTITNYKRNGCGSLRSNEATFDFLSQLLEKAMQEETDKSRKLVPAVLTIMVVFVAFLIAFFMKQW